MNPSVEATLRAQRDRGRKLLMPYVTGGLGSEWAPLLPMLAEAGADAIEIGIPFSDPVMDGPTIQEASAKALNGGTTPLRILEQVSTLDMGPTPLIAMTYYNLAFHMGEKRFADSLASAGISGAILPDLPLEESATWEQVAQGAGVEATLLAAPVTPDDRLSQIADRSRGFVYAVGIMGVTGERQSLASSATTLAKRLKAVTDKPVVIGFGISTPQQAVEACSEADGVVVASALMRRLLDGAGNDELVKFVGALRSALDNG